MNNCIFISCNKSFVNILVLCLQSITKNYPTHWDIIICHTDLTHKEKLILSKFKKIIFLKNTIKEYEIGPIMWHLPKETDPKVFYARFLLWREKIFDKYDNILHLDADTIIMKNIDELLQWNNFIITKEIYEWDDSIFKNNNDKQLEKQLFKDNIKINNSLTANCWVFILPKKYRNPFFYNQLMYILKKYYYYIKRADQSIINIWIAYNKLTIRKTFNLNFQHRIILQSNKQETWFKDTYILHFNGIDNNLRFDLMSYWLKIKNKNFYSKRTIDKYLQFYNYININE